MLRGRHAGGNLGRSLKGNDDRKDVIITSPIQRIVHDSALKQSKAPANYFHERRYDAPAAIGTARTRLWLSLSPNSFPDKRAFWTGTSDRNNDAHCNSRAHDQGVRRRPSFA